MSKALVVGGSRGIGQAIVLKLLERGFEHVYIAGKEEPLYHDIPEEKEGLFKAKTSFYRINLVSSNYSIFEKLNDIDTLVITAGFGRVALFEELLECEIDNLIKCNVLAIIQIIRKYYHRIKSDQEFNCGVMVSISGHIVSPMFAVYSAAKAGLAMFIENVNTELIAGGFKNRILDCSPGSVKGTAFNGGKNDIASIMSFANEFINKMQEKEMIFIPEYEKIFKGVIDRYHNDPIAYGQYSYNYKLKSGRYKSEPQVVVGYLSGTFDLFHIGHLNLLRRAKEQCDYLIVGVHESGAWKGKETFIPFDERIRIVESIKYVDKVIKSYPEDMEAWQEFHYHKLFVGSDYKNSERFTRYEKYFQDKNMEIIYLPYTKETSSTQLRERLKLENTYIK